jgi:uncharacterized coiled-coil DUF342 family protein
MENQRARELEARIAELDRRIEEISVQLEHKEVLKICRRISQVEFVLQTTALQLESEDLIAERRDCLERLAKVNRAV